MNLQAKKVLYIDLFKRESEVKSHKDLNKYIGGVGLGAKILKDFNHKDAVVFSVGPLSGMFPYASKTSVLFRDGKEVRDLYLGGSLSSRIKFSGLDAILIFGLSAKPAVLDVMGEKVTFEDADVDVGKLGLPGKKSFINVDEKNALLDGYFRGSGNYLHKILIQKNLKSFVITGSKTFELKNFEKYTELYDKILERVDEMLVEKGGNSSCVGCPLGCGKSKTGEDGGNVLVHSLVACSFAEPIYSEENTVFSCLNSLGYDYTHEDIENLPKLVYDVLEDLV